MSDFRLQAESRARIRIERNGDPNWVDLGDGWFALHIQYGGNAVTVHFDGSGDADAFREWLAFHWPDGEAAADRVGRRFGVSDLADEMQALAKALARHTTASVPYWVGVIRDIEAEGYRLVRQSAMGPEVDHSGMGAAFLLSHPDTPIAHSLDQPCATCDRMGRAIG